MCAALVLSLVLVASVEAWLCQDSLFHSVQEKMSNGNDQLLCYYLAVIASWAQIQICCQRGLSAPAQSTFDVRTGGVPQSPISKELLNNSWLCQMSRCIFPIIAQKLRSPCLSSQKRLWTLHCTFQKSFLVLGSLNPDADAVDSRRTEEVKVRTMLCALAHERQCFELNAHNSEAPQISTCIWKTLLHLCFFSYASFRWVWESGISTGLSQKFSGISAREPVLLFLVPQWTE